MSLINISGLTFAYEGSFDNIFENVSFQIDTDWRLGFTGRNGRGKTTFFRLLMGKYEYKGSISASVDFEYFPYDVPDMTLTAAEIAEQICPDAQQWQVVRELSLLEVDDAVLWQPFDTLSGGERAKLLLAALFLRENSFLLIDEPTNHLDIHGRRLVSRYLRSKKGYIVISHDREFLDGCVDHILSINRADIEIQRGNFSSWLVNRQRQDCFELAENEKHRREIKRLEQTAREKARWSDTAESRKIGIDPSRTEKSMNRRPYEGAKAEKAMRRSKAIEGRIESKIEEKSKLLKNIETTEALKLQQLHHYSDRLITVRELSLSYDSRTITNNVSFEIMQGDRAVLRGRNGCGKSSILKLIMGEDITHTGELQLAGRLRISYVSQDTSELSGRLESYAESCGIDLTRFLSILRKLDFSRTQFEKNMSDYSGGQKKKVLIARSLCEQAHLLVWDEPLNFIDVISRMQIEKLLLEYHPTMLFVEHDAAFCEKIATMVIELQ